MIDCSQSLYIHTLREVCKNRAQCIVLIREISVLIFHHCFELRIALCFSVEGNVLKLNGKGHFLSGHSHINAKKEQELIIDTQTQ